MTVSARSLCSSAKANGSTACTPCVPATSAIAAGPASATTVRPAVDNTTPPAARMRADTSAVLSPGKTVTSIRCASDPARSSAATAVSRVAPSSRPRSRRSLAETFIAGRYGVTSSTQGWAASSGTRSGSIPISSVNPGTLSSTAPPSDCTTPSHSGAAGPASLTR
jgi:hypothetical protein